METRAAPPGAGMQLIVCTVTPPENSNSLLEGCQISGVSPDVPAAAPDHVAVRPCGAAAGCDPATLDPPEEDL